MFNVFKYKEHGIRRAQLKVLSDCFTCVSLLQHSTGTNWRQVWRIFFLFEFSSRALFIRRFLLNHFAFIICLLNI